MEWVNVCQLIVEVEEISLWIQTTIVVVYEHQRQSNQSNDEKIETDGPLKQ